MVQRAAATRDKPFFLMYQHKAPHRNWQPGPKYLNKYDDVTMPEPDTLFDDYEGRGTAAKNQKMMIARDLIAARPQTGSPRVEVHGRTAGRSGTRPMRKEQGIRGTQA